MGMYRGLLNSVNKFKAFTLCMLFVMAPSTVAEESKITGVKTMSQDKPPAMQKEQAPQIPPEVMAYLQGANKPEHQQFEFLIGDWDVDVTRLNPDGSTQLQHKAVWTAQYLNDKRMIMDDFKALSPTGQPVSSFVTLRTFSEITKRWQMAGLAAFLPSTTSEWYGEVEGDDMVLTAKGTMPDGKPVVNRIHFYNIQTDSFEWQSEMSFDDGEHWVKMMTLKANRSQDS